MSHSENKRLIFGLMVGAAGITLAVLWYRKTRECRKAVHLPMYLNAEKSFDLVDSSYDAHNNEQGTVMLLQGRQLQILEKLNGLLVSVDELKREVKFLKEAIPKLEELVREDLQGKTDSQRTSPLHRATKKRKIEEARGVSDTTSSEEAESEGGYITAHTDTESEEEKGSLNSSTSVLTPEEKTELHNLLQEVDRLHGGSDNEQRESFRLLLENEEKYRNSSGFLWRFARAYGDMFSIATEAEEKKNYASEGKHVGENAINLDASIAESHQWFAVMCGYMSQFESIQNKIKNGYLFKEHLDKAIELKPQDPFLYYLNGRWCYENYCLAELSLTGEMGDEDLEKVAQLSWIEKKVAAALFGTPPTSTIHEALQNFLKAEEIRPGYSKQNYVYMAKCYKDLGQRTNALQCCESALSLLSVTKEDKEAEKELEVLLPSLKL